MKIAAAYVRVSTDDQTEYSPDSQIKLVTEYAKKNDMVLPPEFIFQDDGISGKDAKHRPSFNEMISLAKSPEHPFDVILVWKFSRFARNQEESIVFKNLLRRKNVEVRSITEPIIDGTFGTLIERIIEWMDEYYLINLSTEVKRGMLEKASRGEAVSVAPVGYDIVDGELVPNADAILVKEIFQEFNNGTDRMKLTALMRAKGLKTNRGNLVDRRCIDYILHNPIYAGKIRWSIDGRAASTRDYDNENIRIFDGHHTPIISQEAWNEAQKKLKEIKAIYPKYQKSESVKEFSLRGLLRCSSCGTTLSNSGDGWQCSSYATSRGCTESHYVSKIIAEQAVLDGLKESAKTMKFEVSGNNKKRKSTDNSELINAEKRKLARLKKAYEVGADTLDEYVEGKKRILENIKKLENEQQPEEVITAEMRKDRIENAIKLLESSADEKTKNIALRGLINYVVFNRSKSDFRIVFN